MFFTCFVFRLTEGQGRFQTKAPSSDKEVRIMTHIPEANGEHHINKYYVQALRRLSLIRFHFKTELYTEKKNA